MIRRRRTDKTLIFQDHPEFRPNLTPREIFEQGAFGGTYWRPIYSGVTNKSYKNQHHKYNFFSTIPEDMMSSEICDISKNKYKKHSGTSLEYWESKGWINKQDPYGWVQWYCEFYSGRRSDDDERQIQRWLNFAGENGRFLRRLIGLVKKKKGKIENNINDYSISPVIRQGLHHWGKVLCLADIKLNTNNT